MAIARVIGRPSLLQVHRYHPWGMSAIHERIHAAFGQLLHDPVDGKNKRGLARHMIDQRQARSLCDQTEDCFNHITGRTQREWNVNYDHLRTETLSHEVERITTGIVLVVSDEQFVFWVKPQRAQDGVYTGRRVRDKYDVLVFRAQESRQFGARFIP